MDEDALIGLVMLVLLFAAVVTGTLVLAGAESLVARIFARRPRRLHS